MTIIKSNFPVTLEGRGEIILRPSNYLATGGEGSVYRLNDTIVKLFTDPDRMSKDGYDRKLTLLKNLSHRSIVSPLGFVFQKNRPIGYYMRYVDGEPMSRMFTNDFIVRHGITIDKTINVVRDMREIVLFAHGKQAILVDANELNWMVELGGKVRPIAIDVDSWAIGPFKGNVIMPSIRDWQAKEFDQKSDWFAWGIVTFQLFTGIHPYKGTLLPYNRGDMEARMKANASVFSPGVKLSHAVRDFSLIPKGLRGWYEAVFQKGERCVPPERFDEAVGTGTIGLIYRAVVTSNKALTYSKLYDSNQPIINIFPSGIALIGSELVRIKTKEVIGTAKDKNAELIEIDDGYVVAENDNKKASLRYVKRGIDETLPFEISTSRFIRYGNRLFAVTENGLTEIVFHHFKKRIATAGRTWNALPYGVTWFQGFGVQNALGATYLIMPFGQEECAHVRVKELDGNSFISAYRGERTLSLIALTKVGKWKRFDLTFSKDFTSYSIGYKDVDTSDLSIVSLPKGVTVEIVDDGVLEVFALGSTSAKSVEDKNIFADGKLYAMGNTVLYERKGSLFSISMS